MPKRKWYLEQCLLFKPLSQHRIARLGLQSEIRDFTSGSRICSARETIDTVFFLASGRVKSLQVTESGKENILAIVDAGELFGELALFVPDFQSEAVEAIVDSTVLLIRAGALRHMIRKDHDLLLRFTQLISSRRNQAELRVKSLLFRSPRHRLANLLLDLAKQQGRQTDRGLTINLSISHQDMASQIGVTRESVTLTLGKLKCEGVISFDRHNLVIHQPDKLA